MTGGSEVRVERVERVAGACREGGGHMPEVRVRVVGPSRTFN